jgi:DNA-binding response OmpR family regulator
VNRHGRRIAIVEDEPVIRANYADVLRKQGYEVAAYASRGGRSARFEPGCGPRPIDIGLADDIDGGFALCRELRALSANLPIIFFGARFRLDIVAGLPWGRRLLTKDASLPHCSRAFRCSSGATCSRLRRQSRNDRARQAELDLKRLARSGTTSVSTSR